MRVILIAVVLLSTTATWAVNPVKETDAAKRFRGRCHAHRYYMWGLNEDDAKSRMKLLTKAIEFDTALYRAYYNRGVLHIRDGDLKSGQTDFEKAAELKKSYIFAHYNLACVHALASRKDEALKSLDVALSLGYRKFDKIGEDADLKVLRDDPGLARIIERYRASTANSKLTPIQEIQLAAVGLREGILFRSVQEKHQDTSEVIEWASYAPSFRLRAAAMNAALMHDADDAIPTLVRGLYDSNGYVNKAAANALIAYGVEAKGPVTVAMVDKDFGIPFYARQILIRINDDDGIQQATAALKEDDPRRRIAAAAFLASRGAARALPEIEAAMNRQPKAENEKTAYRAALEDVVEWLIRRNNARANQTTSGGKRGELK